MKNLWFLVLILLVSSVAIAQETRMSISTQTYTPTGLKNTEEIIKGQEAFDLHDAMTGDELDGLVKDMLRQRDVVYEGPDREVSYHVVELHDERGVQVDGFVRVTEIDRDNEFRFFDQAVMVKPFLGVEIEDHEEAVFVKQVLPETGASEAGIKAGDVILSINNRPTSNSIFFQNRIIDNKPGDEVTLVIAREGKELSIDATLGENPEEEEQVVFLKKQLKCAEFEPRVKEIARIIISSYREKEVEDIPREENVLELQDLVLYPNPSSGILRLTFDGEKIDTRVQLTDMSGQVLFSNQKNLAQGSYDSEIDLTAHPSGTYVLIISQDNKRLTRQVILNK